MIEIIFNFDLSIIRYTGEIQTAVSLEENEGGYCWSMSGLQEVLDLKFYIVYNI